jgi:hypothetical protein
MNPGSDQDSNVLPGIVGTDEEGSDGTVDRMIDEESWYRGEVMGYRFGPHEVANKLLMEMQYVQFAEARRALQVQKQEADDDMAAQYRVRRTVNDTTNRYFLTVIDGKVQVVYGAKWCGHFHETQEHLVVMMGDQCQIGQTVREPKFMRLLGTKEEQEEIFGGTAYAHAKELEEIIEELDHVDNEATLVEEDDALDPAVTWRVFPVHPKLAILFLRGLPVLAAAKLVQEMAAQRPYGEDDFYLLTNFCRVACTAVEGEGSIEVAWTPVHPTESNQLFEWCQGLKANYAPSQTVASFLPPPPPPVPQEPRAREPDDEGRDQRLAGAIAAAVAASQEEVTTRASSKRFTKKEIGRFIALAGLEVSADSGVSVMTPFFRGLEEDRGSKIRARLYVEQELKSATANDPMAQMEMTTRFSTEVISAIQNVDVTGSDYLVTWELRQRGCTPFNLAPAPDHLGAAAEALRAECMEFEEYEHRSHQDVKQSKAVHTSVEEWPTTRDRLRAWILTYRGHMITMFGNDFIARPLLDRLLMAMRKERNWEAVDVVSCMTLTWGIHRGLRLALIPAPTGDLSYLRQLVVDFETGRVPSLASVGPIIAKRITDATAKPSSNTLGYSSVPQGGSNWSNGPYTTGPSSSTKKRSFEKIEYGERVSGPAFAEAWAEDVQAVQTKLGRQFNGTTFCRDQGKLAALFGPGFKALMPPDNSNPCMSYFILGRCHDKCHRSHTTTTPPSEQILSGMKSRIHAHSQQLLKPKNT